MDGQLNTGSVTVQNGATLTGAGELDGPVTVLNGGRLAPGAGGVGVLTIKNSLSLAGTAVMELSKTGVDLVERPSGGHHHARLRRVARW